MLVHAVYAVFLTHPSNGDAVPHIVKMCERRSANGLTGLDLSTVHSDVIRINHVHLVL